jgi:hypothetical protein
MADVSSTFASWSSTTGSNSPQGTATVGNGVDDNLREIQGAVVRGLSHKGSDIASSSTTDLGAVEGKFHDITGTSTISSFGTVRAGIEKVLTFEGALTLTYNSTSLILPGGANILTAAGDVATFYSEGSGNWRCTSFLRGNGLGTVLSAEQATTTGTSIDFTSIPAWVKRITLQLAGVSTSGSSDLIIQIGDAGGVEATGYLGTAATVTDSTQGASSYTVGFGLHWTGAATSGSTFHGHVVLTLQDASDFRWVMSGNTSKSNAPQSNMASGSKALSAALDRVRLTTAGGTDTFDAGVASILYE